MPVFLQMHVVDGSTNVKIRGRGTIDADGIKLAGDASNPDRFTNMIHTLLITNSSDVTLEGVTLRNSTYWTFVAA
ncbi:hypothetical protein D3C75_684970 [compost metagenome]